MSTAKVVVVVVVMMTVMWMLVVKLKVELVTLMLIKSR